MYSFQLASIRSIACLFIASIAELPAEWPIIISINQWGSYFNDAEMSNKLSRSNAKSKKNVLKRVYITYYYVNYKYYAVEKTIKLHFLCVVYFCNDQ